MTQHASIVKDWQDCPVAKCTKCCRWVRASEGQYHCPLCPVSVYPPSTKDRLQRHLQEHQRDSISCGGDSDVVFYRKIVIKSDDMYANVIIVKQ